MIIILVDLNNLKREDIKIQQNVEINSSYYENSSIKDLNNIYVEGKIYYNYLNQIQYDLSVKGEMTLLDSITLEEIIYPFDIKIEEILEEKAEELYDYYKKSENTLDILGILWQNIVLEVPIRITNSKVEEQSGNGWELNETKKNKVDPRLAKLQELLEEEGKE